MEAEIRKAMQIVEKDFEVVVVTWARNKIEEVRAAVKLFELKGVEIDFDKVDEELQQLHALCVGHSQQNVDGYEDK
jgi:uncharacterized protein YpuA (DUF1002 family)